MKAQDAKHCEQIADSCRVIVSHASFIGAAATDIMSLSPKFTPVCVSELDETESVLRRALAKVNKARADLAVKQRRAA